MARDHGTFETPRTIVLVGHMGAGKTCIGKRLAKRLGVDFVDADAEVEKAAGMSIPEIFEMHGEKAFRAGEHRVIARLLRRPPHVLATGGGAFMNPATRELIARRAVSVWLRADLDLLARRTSRRNNRPLLWNGDRHEVLGRLMSERDPVYGQADVVVDSADAPPEVTTAAVQQALADFIRRTGTGPPEAVADDGCIVAETRKEDGL